jgi:hypothetical protein
MGLCGARQGASEAGSTALGAADNATPGKPCLRAGLFTSSLMKSRREAIETSEAGGAPSSAAPPGVGLPQGGLTPRSEWHGANALRSFLEADFAARAASAGVGRDTGARFGMSVAEIGETYLSCAIKVSREASQEGAG